MGEGSSAYTVKLATRPSSSVTVTISGGWEADLTLGTTSLSFTNANWNTPQTVTVSAGQDDAAVNDRETLAHTAAGGSYASVRRNLSVTVNDDDTRALEIFLSSVGRMVASDAVEIISRRFDPRIGDRPMLTLGGRSLILNQNESIGHLSYAINPAQDITSAAGPGHRVPPDPRTALLLSHLRRATVWDVLSSSDFRVPLKSTRDASGWTLWGRGAMSGFAGAPGSTRRMDADAFSSYVGIDYNVRAKALLGLAATHSVGDLSYREATSGRTLVPIDFVITSLLPYLHLQPHPRLGLLGLFRFGRGSVELIDADGGLDTDLTLMMGAGGGRQHLTTLGGVGFALKGDAFYVETTSDRNARLPEVRGDAKRVRLLIEGRHTHTSGRKTRLSQSLEFGARWDRGRVENGRGMDVGGGIDYAHTERGISLSARGGYLLLHEQAGFEEWVAHALWWLVHGKPGLPALSSGRPVGNGKRHVLESGGDARNTGAGRFEIWDQALRTIQLVTFGVSGLALL